MAADLAGADWYPLLERMWLIRAFEERASELYATGRLGGLLHLSIGQEGVAVGLASVLRPSDVLFVGHRAHGHALAKGADPGVLLAELAGRAAGYCGGKGGSMHIAAPEVGLVTATGVVGGNIALGVGGALSCAEAGSEAVSVSVFGDGAAQTGTFHESLNIASLWSLPLVFVCENNGYAEFTPLSAHTKVEVLARHAETYGIPSVTIDGNDVVAVRAAMAEAVARARAKEGCSFVECLTYRSRGHYEGDPGRYRGPEELADWRERDPILRLLQAMAADPDEREAVSSACERRAREAVDRAVQVAFAGPEPALDVLTTQVFAP